MKKYLSIFLIIVMTVVPVASFALLPGGMGNWKVAVTNVAKKAAGVSGKFTFTKAANDATYAATKTVSNNKIASHWLMRFARFGALSVGYEAISKLLQGVDWIMDPENNQIYKIEKSKGYAFCYADTYEYTVGKCFTTMQDFLDDVQPARESEDGKQKWNNFTALNLTDDVIDEVIETQTYKKTYLAYKYDYTTNDKTETYDNNVGLNVVPHNDETKVLITEQQLVEDAIQHLTEEQLAEQLQPMEDEANKDVPWLAEAANDAKEVDPNTEPEPEPEPEPEECKEGFIKNDDGQCVESETSEETPSDGSSDLPPFCQWAAPVCDFIEWFKQEPPEPEPPKPVPNGNLSDAGLDFDRFEERIDFQGSCPSSDFTLEIFGKKIVKPIPYAPYCEFLAMIRPWLIAMNLFGAAFFIVGKI